MTHLTSVTFLHHRLVFSSPPPPHDMCLYIKDQSTAPLGGRRRILFFPLSLLIKQQMTPCKGGREYTVVEQEYLSGNSHPSFIIDHKEDLIGGSNSWMGMDGGPSQAALMMTSSESGRQRLLFIFDNRLRVAGGRLVVEEVATPGKIFPFHSLLSLCN